MAWKKNFRKVPQKVLSKLNVIAGPHIVVGCVKRITRESIESGQYFHLEIELNEDGLSFQESIIPSPEQGKHSFWNINGREIVRKDLPKETHYNLVDAPNYGDSYKGTHTVSLPYEKYPRDFIAPRNTTINIECSDTSNNLTHYIIKFELSEVLDRDSKEFDDRLFDCLNLLQENIGDCGIEQAGITLYDYIQTLHVAWDILPPGTIEEAIDRIFHGRQPTEQESQIVNERYDFFITLDPQNLVYGRSGFQRYFGALIEDNLIVFENVKYGNAIYIMFSDWEELSQQSRVDLLSGRFSNDFERVTHVGDWQKKVTKIIEERRGQ